MGLAFGGMREPYTSQAKDITIKWQQKGDDLIATFTGNVKYNFVDIYDFRPGGSFFFKLGYCVQETGYAGIYNLKVVIEKPFSGAYSKKRKQLIKQEDCDGSGCEKRKTWVVRSFDPNDKAGPAGQGAGGYIGDGNMLMPYTIRFENKKSASAPAVIVTVTDILDADLDLSTFELNEIGFADQTITVPPGLQNYETNLDLIMENEFLTQPAPIRVNVKVTLEPVTRRLELVLTGLDPQTGWLPEDVMLGFLYPNDENHRGEGFLRFSVKPKAGLTEGAEITNKASIVFDWNEPIITNETLNTIGEPLSLTLLEPDGIDDTADKSFEINWKDHDPIGKADIAMYYATDNTGQGGTLIESNIPVTDETDKITWNTADIPEGKYYIYAVIDDGINPAITAYGRGPVTVERSNTPPTITITEPGGEIDAADQSFTVTWTDNDIEDNAAITLYYDTDNQGADGTLIASGISEDDDTDSYSWDTSKIPAGDYYIYAVIDDGTNDTVTGYSETPVTIYHLVPPANVTAKDTPQDNGGSIDISWQQVPNDDAITGYKIFRSETPGTYDYTSHLVALLKGSVSYTDGTVLDGQNYYYVIRTYNQFSDSTDSEEAVGVAKDNLPPAVPTGLGTQPGLDKVSLSWKACADSDLAGYNIYRRDSESSGYTKIGTATAVSYIDSGLGRWDTYYYAVTSFDEVPNESDFSGAAKAVSPQGQTDDIAEMVLNLPDKAFKNNPRQRKKTFKNKLSEVKTMIDNGRFKKAIDKLKNDIRQKTDGCHGGKPNNDWITDCKSQTEVYTAINNLIKLLKTLL